MEIVVATRNSEMLDFGVSPRGSLALRRAAQALAFTEDRSYCIADDVKRLTIPIFGHRVAINSRYLSRNGNGVDSDSVLAEIIRTVRVPI
jgi:MoxR-like ATPase